METLYVSFLLILNPSFHLLLLFLLLPVLQFLAHIIDPLVFQRAVYTVLRFSKGRYLLTTRHGITNQTTSVLACVFSFEAEHMFVLKVKN
jgi:hypothetical protein